MAALLLAVGWPRRAAAIPHRAPNLLDPRALARMLKLGSPIGAQMVLETGVFGAVALLMGWLGVGESPLDQVALNLASLTFMVPLGVSSAAAVVVGHAVGRGDAARRVADSTAAALIVGAGFMLCAGALFVCVPESARALYTNDAAVIALTASCCRSPACSRCSTACRSCRSGVLRGIGDTQAPVVTTSSAFGASGCP